MKLVWNQTGDWLDLDPVNYELADYWVNSLEQSNVNSFHLEKSYFDLSWPSSLKTHIREVNDFLTTKLKIDTLSTFLDQDLLDQHVLNTVHSTWIKLIQDYPALVKLISNNSELHQHWNQINKKVHAIEEGVAGIFVARQYWETSNVFGTDILDFNQCQIQLIFSQEGRSTFNKWDMFDYNIDGQDTNDFLKIGSEVLINLRRVKSNTPPVEYVEFCKSRGVPVVGNTLNLANFRDFETNLCKLRHVYLRNIANEDNTASFKF